MGVARATTPTFTLTFDEQGLDLTQAENVYVTFSSGGKKVTKTGEDLIVTTNTISVFLSQADTLEWRDGEVLIQANWTSSDGQYRASSNIVRCEISGQLLNEVVP